MDKTLRDVYVETIADIFEKAVEIVRKKSQDYATGADPFRNFRDSAQFAGVSVEQGILVRLADKYSRIRNLLERNPQAEAKEGGAVGEAIEDTLKDAINYTAILLTWLTLGRPEAGTEYATDEEFAVTAASGIPVASANLLDQLVESVKNKLASRDRTRENAHN